jgi:NADH-quinone oxidoreductase subunit A
MLERTYLPVLLLMGFVILNAVAILALSALVTRSRPNPEKLAAYESGMPPLGDARERFSVKFYMVAMLFIVFDIETVFMIPWGVLYRQLSCAPGAFDAVRAVCPAGQLSLFGLVEMLVFIAILLVGLVYVWKKGALQWD